MDNMTEICNFLTYSDLDQRFSKLEMLFLKLLHSLTMDVIMCVCAEPRNRT
eukprot:COSAG01_NODE_4916_length_4629_cov_1.893157_4_plen_51_part_00